MFTSQTILSQPSMNIFEKYSSRLTRYEVYIPYCMEGDMLWVQFSLIQSKLVQHKNKKPLTRPEISLINDANLNIHKNNSEQNSNGKNRICDAIQRLQIETIYEYSSFHMSIFDCWDHWRVQIRYFGNRFFFLVMLKLFVKPAGIFFFLFSDIHRVNYSLQHGTNIQGH
jgi:hypothetical protein